MMTIRSTEELTFRALRRKENRERQNQPWATKKPVDPMLNAKRIAPMPIDDDVRRWERDAAEYKKLEADNRRKP